MSHHRVIPLRDCPTRFPVRIVQAVFQLVYSLAWNLMRLHLRFYFFHRMLRYILLHSLFHSLSYRSIDHPACEAFREVRVSGSWYRKSDDRKSSLTYFRTGHSDEDRTSVFTGVETEQGSLRVLIAGSWHLHAVCSVLDHTSVHDTCQCFVLCNINRFSLSGKNGAYIAGKHSPACGKSAYEIAQIRIDLQRLRCSVQ